jgi:hypothetical protein
MSTPGKDQHPPQTPSQDGARDPLAQFEAERRKRDDEAGQEGAGAGLGQGGQAHLKDGPDNPLKKR